MQATVEKEVSFSGIGLHTGTHNKITIEPAPPDNGIVFYTQKSGIRNPESRIQIPALIDFVSDTKHGVCLKYKNSEVRTCEHILSALNGLGITNAFIKVQPEADPLSRPVPFRDGLAEERIEIPALDGSSLEFTKLIKPKLQHKKTKTVEIKEPIFVGDGNASIFIVPNRVFKISFLVDYPNSALNTQHACFTVFPQTYLKEIAPARTYSFKNWISQLKTQGLIKGGSIDNAIIIDENGPLTTLRFPDELVRHKILDVVGDLALLGANIKGWVFGIKSGHTLNIKLVKAILVASRNPAG